MRYYCRWSGPLMLHLRAGEQRSRVSPNTSARRCQCKHICPKAKAWHCVLALKLSSMYCACFSLDLVRGEIPIQERLHSAFCQHTTPPRIGNRPPDDHLTAT